MTQPSQGMMGFVMKDKVLVIFAFFGVLTLAIWVAPAMFGWIAGALCSELAHMARKSTEGEGE